MSGKKHEVKRKEGGQLRYINNAKGWCSKCFTAVEGEAIEELERIRGTVFTYLYHPRCFVEAKKPLFDRLKRFIFLPGGATPAPEGGGQ
ncbi:MAG: hypothetical protein ACP5KV_07640 [Candidatus Methanomethylicaceae archaeon]